MRAPLLVVSAVLLIAVSVATARPKSEPGLAERTNRTVEAQREAAVNPPATAEASPRSDRSRPHPRTIEWRDSEAVGGVSSGALVRGVMLPAEGIDWASWDPVEKESPNRWWRRWGTDRLVRATLAVIRKFADRHPNAPRILIGDMSRPHGGDFGTRYGPIGHASHQNGLDVDVYYPRTDEQEQPPLVPGEVDVARSQDLVDLFVAAGAERVFVGPNLPLTGPAEVVVPLVNHDNHLHFRLPA